MVRMLVALFLVGCPSNSEYPPPDPLPAEFVADCTDASDCVALELGCCDSCNGGVRVAVRADRADDARERFAEGCGANTACTLIGCALPVATCDATATCALAPAPEL